MGKVGRPRKPQFDLVPSELKDAIGSMGTDEINKKISEVAKAECVNKQAMKDDMQLKEARVAAAMAASGYKEATKTANQIIEFCRRVLADRGKE